MRQLVLQLLLLRVGQLERTGLLNTGTEGYVRVEMVGVRLGGDGRKASAPARPDASLR